MAPPAKSRRPSRDGAGSSRVSRATASATSADTRSITVSTLMRPAMCSTKNTSMATLTKASSMPTLSDRWGMKVTSWSSRTVRSTSRA